MSRARTSRAKRRKENHMECHYENKRQEVKHVEKKVLIGKFAREQGITLHAIHRIFERYFKIEFDAKKVKQIVEWIHSKEPKQHQENGKYKILDNRFIIAYEQGIIVTFYTSEKANAKS